MESVCDIAVNLYQEFETNVDASSTMDMQTLQTDRNNFHE